MTRRQIHSPVRIFPTHMNFDPLLLLPISLSSFCLFSSRARRPSVGRILEHTNDDDDDFKRASKSSVGLLLRPSFFSHPPFDALLVSSTYRLSSHMYLVSLHVFLMSVFSLLTSLSVSVPCQKDWRRHWAYSRKVKALLSLLIGFSGSVRPFKWISSHHKDTRQKPLLSFLSSSFKDKRKERQNSFSPRGRY